MRGRRLRSSRTMADMQRAGWLHPGICGPGRATGARRSGASAGLAGGRVTAETFTWLREELVESLRRELPVDAVLLALHGGLAADTAPDVEGEVLERCGSCRSRGAAGGDARPARQHHGADGRGGRRAVLYHTAPHIDVFETGRRGPVVLRRLLVDGVSP